MVTEIQLRAWGEEHSLFLSLEVEGNSEIVGRRWGMKNEGTHTPGGEKGWSLVSAANMPFTLKNKIKEPYLERFLFFDRQVDVLSHRYFILAVCHWDCLLPCVFIAFKGRSLSHLGPVWSCQKSLCTEKCPGDMNFTEDRQELSLQGKKALWRHFPARLFVCCELGKARPQCHLMGHLSGGWWNLSYSPALPFQKFSFSSLLFFFFSFSPPLRAYFKAIS